MKERQTGERRCPYLKQVVMVFCEACPIKKMVPLDRIHTASHCFEGGFESCALFADIAARVDPPPNKRRPRSRGTAAEETTR